MDHSQWIQAPPAGALWLVEDTLTQLNRAGADTGNTSNVRIYELLDRAQTVLENERLWGGVDRNTLRSQLSAALNACRGYNS